MRQQKCLQKAREAGRLAVVKVKHTSPWIQKKSPEKCLGLISQNALASHFPTHFSILPISCVFRSRENDIQTDQSEDVSFSFLNLDWT